MSEYKAEFNGETYKIRAQMMQHVTEYVQNGLIPGSFLQAVICNDLQGAYGKADNDNLKNLPAFVMYFMWEVPSTAWGSEKNMIAWSEQGGLGEDIIDRPKISQ